ncbi:MAG: hypothetical protein NWE95_13400 [Candidatus Bathyarchaeota archaeon]|nr:hypothetical protein [Candidatus Bathyarchaeota archaeon]
MVKPIKRIIVLLVVLVLVAAACLVLISTVEDTALPSPFLIAGLIVALVMMGGTIFSLYIEKRSKSRTVDFSVGKQ